MQLHELATSHSAYIFTPFFPFSCNHSSLFPCYHSSLFPCYQRYWTSQKVTHFRPLFDGKKVKGNTTLYARLNTVKWNDLNQLFNNPLYQFTYGFTYSILINTYIYIYNELGVTIAIYTYSKHTPCSYCDITRSMLRDKQKLASCR